MKEGERKNDGEREEHAQHKNKRSFDVMTSQFLKPSIHKRCLPLSMTSCHTRTYQADP